MKRIFGVTLILVLLLFMKFCLAEELGGGYSLDLFGNWHSTEMPGLKYKGVFTEFIDGFAPNIINQYHPY